VKKENRSIHAFVIGTVIAIFGVWFAIAGFRLNDIKDATDRAEAAVIKVDNKLGELKDAKASNGCVVNIGKANTKDKVIVVGC